MGIKRASQSSPKRRSVLNKLTSRRALLESLEQRQLLAGPDLIAIRPDAGGLLRDGDTLNVAPREFNLLFAGGANLDETTISSSTVKLTRAGNDGVLGSLDDINVALGFVGLVNPGSTDPSDLAHIVLRPASSAGFNSKDATNQFPDDEYQIQIVGAGTPALQNLAGEAFSDGTDLTTKFRLDRGAQIVSIVPQPVTRGVGNVLSQNRRVIEVYFDDQQLVQNDAENANFYRLYNAVTLLPAANPTPSIVNYSAANNMATLTFLSDIPEGSYRLDIGQALDNNPVVDSRGNLGISDNSVSFGTSIPLGIVNVGASADRTIRVSGRIEAQTSIALPPLPGGQDDPGHREIQREAHIGASGTTPTVPAAVRTIQYYFPLVLGTFNSGDPMNPGQYLNLITETEKQIVRDIFEIYAKDTGLEFIEGTAGGGLSIGKGDLRALDPTIGPSAGVAGLGGPGAVVLNDSLYSQSNRFYGDDFTGTMYHEIGHALSLSHAYDQPAVQGAAPIPNEVLPGDNDLLHLKRISPPNSTDIDVYSFTLPKAGRLSAEIFAERLATPSLLNSALALYKLNSTTGERTLVARNDQYFGADAFLDLELDAGDYFIGVSSTGNTNYDLNVPNSGFGGTTDGLYDLSLNFKPAAVAELRDTRGTALDGDADGTPGGVYQFWFQSATVANTIFVDKLADTLAAPGQGAGTLANPFESIDLGLAAAAARVGTSVTSPTIVRIVGNGGADNSLSTLADNRPYLVGTTIGGAALADGPEFRVPAGVNVVIDAGSIIKLRKANIDAGSTAAGINRAGGSIQVLGTPTNSVFLRSYHDDSAGGNSDGGTTTPGPGDFGGIVFRDDSDREANGIFLNYVNHADIKHGGGKVFVDSNELPFTSIHITNARPTLSFNLISQGTTAAISASPDSFDDSLRRIGPDIHGNYLVGNSINGLAVRIDTPTGAGLTKLSVSGRFDDTDITHVLSENLIIAGGSGGPVRDGGGTLTARPAGRLQIDPGVVVKLNRARIEVERGDGTLIAEGTVDRPIVFTAQDDKRYGGSGSFDTNQSPATSPQPGTWSGLFFGEGTSGSIDQSIITFGGGNSGIEGSDFPFNAVEIHQADVRIVNSLLQDNAATTATSNSRRNGRGSNGVATIYVRGAQPVIVNNVIKNNVGSAISINANSLVADIQRDYGRSTGPAEVFNLFDDNYGPLVRLNRLENNGSVGAGVNGMLVRGEEVTVESVWDDTDIVHVLRNEVTVDNLHSLGGLTLQSSNSESLVVKLFGGTAGFTATGTPVEIIDRIGGTIHVLGTVGHPVVFTSLNDDTIGAGFTASGLSNRNTNNSASPTSGSPGQWRGLLFDEFSNDRNVAIVRELENPLTNKQNINGTPTLAQNLGTLAPNLATVANPRPDQKAGDNNSRLGFEVHGFISPDDGRDTDVYSFTGTNGTPIWIDIDRTDSTLDAVVELIDATTGNTIASSDSPNSFGGTGASTLTQNVLLGGDYYTQNYRDPGFFYVLSQPGAADGSKGTFFIRVSSKPATAGNAQSRGKYQLQIRTQQVDEFAGSTVRFSDIRFADTGIDVRGLPAHSPLYGEAGEALAADGGDINNVFGTAATLANLLQTDAAAIGLSGALRSDTDVDWYQFDLNQTGVQVIGGVNDGAGTVAVVFDIDYADGAVSADTTVAVYDQNQRLIYIGRESNIEDDQRPAGQLGITDLSRGSLGQKDSYIGPIHLSPGLNGQKYYVAVMSNRQQPSSLNGIFTSDVSPETARTRLEPVNSVKRIIEDHIGFTGYSSNGVTISPSGGGLFDITDGSTLNNHIDALSFSDVGFYIATDVNGITGNQGANDSLYTYNPFTGGPVVTRVTNSVVTGFDDVQDIVVRSDGRMFGYARIGSGGSPGVNNQTTVGALVEIDPSTGQVLTTQNDNILGPTTPNVAGTFSQAIVNATSRDTRAAEFTTSDEVDAFTFQRTGTTAPATQGSAPVPTYDTYYVVRESRTLTNSSSKLYRGTQDGNAATALVGGGKFYGAIGDIQPADVTYASQFLTVFTIPAPGSTAPTTTILIESKIPGAAGNFIINASGGGNNSNVVVNATSTTLNLTIGDNATAGDVASAINSNSNGNQFYTAVIYSGNSNNPNLGDGSASVVAEVIRPPVVNVVGDDGTGYGPLKGRVTGLSFGDFDSNANRTLYGVTNAGEFLTINPNTGDVITAVDTGNSIGVPNLQFQGLTLGPQNVDGGIHKNKLFAVTQNGEVVAFDLAGNGLATFDTATQTQVITVGGPGARPALNAGSFTLTGDIDGAGASPRLTTVPIAYNAPATFSVNETQTFDTDADGGTFTLSFVDDVGAITSPSQPLNGGILDTTLFVQSKVGFPPNFPFVIQIDNEQMLVTGDNGLNAYTVTRQHNGPTLAAHSDTATVFEIVSTSLNANITLPVSTTLSAAIDPSVTTLTVPNTNVFPGGTFTIRIDDEEMLAFVQDGTTLSIQRQQNGTPPQSHNVSRPITVVSERITVIDTTPFGPIGVPTTTKRLRIDSEDMRIANIFSTTEIDVVRGINGTTIAAHFATSDVFRVDTTAPIAYNAPAAVPFAGSIREALEALPSVGAGNVLVTGGPLSGFQSDTTQTTPVTVEFQGPLLSAGTRGLRGINLQQLTVDKTFLVGDEIQTLELDPNIVAGTFQLEFLGDITVSLPFDATAAQVQLALEALPSIGLGNVLVTTPAAALPVGPLNIQLTKDLQDQNVNQINLAPASTVKNEIQRLDFNARPVNAGSFRLRFANPDPNVNPLLPANTQTGVIQHDATNGAIRNALQNAFPGLAGNISVTGGPINLAPVDIEFINELAGLEIEDLVVVAQGFNPVSAVVLQSDLQTVIETVNQQQTITLAGTPTGMFTLSINDINYGLVGTTSNIAFNATNTDIRDALVAQFPSLTDGFGIDNIVVTGGPIDVAPVTIEFVVDLAGQEIGPISIDDTNLVGATGSVAVTRTAVDSLRLNERQQIIQTGTTATGGNFTLTINDPINQIVGSAVIPWNANLVTVRTLLETNITGLFGNIAVTGGALPGNPITIEFVNKYAGLDINKFQVSADNLAPAPGANATVTTLRNNVPPQPLTEIQQIANTANTVTGGNYTLSINDPANGLVGVSNTIQWNSNAGTVQTALNAIPGLAGNIQVTGGPLASNPFQIRFTNQLAFLDISPFFLTPIDRNLAPGNAVIQITELQTSVPQALATIRTGRAVGAQVTTIDDGLLSVFDALDLLPDYNATNIRVAGDLENPPNAGTTVTFIGSLAQAPISTFVVDNFLLQNGTVAAITPSLGGNLDGVADSFVTTISGFSASGQAPVGLAFSPLDFNLWHPTTRRATDTGHGINAADDKSRSPGNVNVDYVSDDTDRRFSQAEGGTSLYFGFEPWLNGANKNNRTESYLSYNGVNAQYGILSQAVHQDLSTNPKLTNTYDLPGGAFGAVETSTFDLANTIDSDRPTLYFTYYLETENHQGSTLNSDGSNPFRDSARVWVKRQGSTTWELLATNNSALSGANPATGVVGELGGFLSHLADAGLNSATPRSVSQQQRQELFDSAGQSAGRWRQARVDLSDYAGETGLQLRFDFSTAGTLFDPRDTIDPFDGNISTGFGEWTDGQRSIRSSANNFEGFYIDDIVIGYAERGEMVTGAGGDSGISDLNGPARTRDPDPNQGAKILSGSYQLEIRRTGEYENYNPNNQLNSVGVIYDTNDRHIIEVTPAGNEDFETLPILGTTLGPVPWSRTATRPQTGSFDFESGNVTTANQFSVYQLTTTDLGGAPTAPGVIEFSFSVSAENNNGLRFFIDGVAQNLVGQDPDFPNSVNPQLATGELDYQTVRFNMSSGLHTFTWVYDFSGGPVMAPSVPNPTILNKAFLDNIVLFTGSTGLLADTNREREQGQFVIESNFISDSRTSGINVEPGTEQGTLGGVSHPGSLINFPQSNANRLVPGVVIANNVVTGSGTGIRFAGETTSNPQRPVPFGRIVNNTLVGVDNTVGPTIDRLGIGVQIVGIASPTLLNNLFTNLDTSIVNNSTAAANGSEAPIIRSNFFQSNDSNPARGTAFLDAGNSGSPFVDAANRNYYPVAGSAAVDSGQDNEQDRADYKTFKIELGIPESAIIAPLRDVYGQLRVDGSGSTTGGGSTVFVDRGAVDRSDKDSPFAALINPIDDDSVDRDPNATVVHLTESLLENFRILLGDGRGPNSPFEGTGINGLTVSDPNDPTIEMNAVTVVHDGRTLVQGIDYTLGYNSLSGILLLTPLATLWDPTGVYVITLDNTPLTGIADLSGRLLRPNQTDGSTKFFILMPDVRLDYGDAPDTFGTTLIPNGARHTIQPGATPRLGASVDGEPDASTPDDTPQPVVVTSPTGSALFTITALPTGQSVQITSLPIGGEQLIVQIGFDSATFEFVAPGAAPQDDNVALPVLAGDTLATVTTKLSDAITSRLVRQGNASAVSIAGSVINVETFNDEDGVGIGTFNDGTTNYRVFLRPGAPEMTTDPADVIGFFTLDTIGTQISVNAGAAGLLDAWIDFNANGAFEVTEQIFTNQPLVVGDNPLSITAPPGLAAGPRWARFRISEQGNLGPNELAIGGEVEDYLIEVVNVAANPMTDTYHVSEDGILDTLTDTLPSVFANDPSPGFLPPRYFVETQPTVGTLTVADDTNGHFVYTPPSDFHGQVTFTYWVSTQPTPPATRPVNATLGTVTIIVDPVNDAPLTTNKSFTTPEEAALTITAAELFAGSIGDATPVFPVGAPATPWNEDNQTFTVRSLTINGMTVNASTPAGPITGVNGTYVANFNAGTGDLINVVFTPSTDFNRDNPQVSGAPNLEQFLFTIQDNNVSLVPGAATPTVMPNAASSMPLTDTRTAFIDVKPQNDPPTATSDIISENGTDWLAYFAGLPTPIAAPIPSEDIDLVIPHAFLLKNDTRGPVTAGDENGTFDPPLTVTGVATSTLGGTVSIVGTDVVYRAPANVFGLDTFVYTITDNGRDVDATNNSTPNPMMTTATVTILVKPINDAPVAQGATYSLTEYQEFADGTNDANPSLKVDGVHFQTIQAADLLRLGTANAARPATLTGAPPFDEAEQSLRISGFGLPGELVPSLTSSSPSITYDGSGLGTGTFTTAQNGTLALTFQKDSTGVGSLVNLVYTPGVDYNNASPFSATDDFVYFVQDFGEVTVPGGATIPNESGTSVGHGSRFSAPATVSFNVTPINDVPVFPAFGDASGNIYVNEDSSADNTSFVVDLYPGATRAIFPGSGTALDESATQEVSISIVENSAPTGLFSAPPTLDVNGNLTLHTNPDAFGVAVYTLTVTETALDGSPLANAKSATRTLTINIDPQNDAPIAQPISFSQAEDSVITFTAADLLRIGQAGAATASDIASSPLYDETEQTLRVVAFTVPGTTNADVASLAGGSGIITRTTTNGGTLSFTFAGGAFTTGTYTPDQNYNSQTPFAATDVFNYIVSDDGQSTIPGSNPVEVRDLADARSAPAPVTITINAVNDPPEFNFIANIEFLERDDLTPHVTTGWATNILPGPLTALDEAQQTVSFAFVPGSSTLPANFFASAPTVLANGQLTLFPAVDAAGTGIIAINATDSGGAVSQVLVTVTIRPVNDAPRVVSSIANTSASLDVDNAYSVNAAGAITYTLKEDNTQAGGVTGSPYVIPLRRGAPVSGYSQIGLLDVFNVGPANEADSTEGGSQILEFVDFEPVTLLGGTIVRSADGNSLLYTPPANYNRTIGNGINGDDSFKYRVRDNSTVGGETYSLASNSLVEDSIQIENTVLLRLNPVNDRPQFTLQNSTAEFREDTGVFTVSNFATAIAAGPSLGEDEFSGALAQTAKFRLTPVGFLATDVFGQIPTISPQGELTGSALPNVFGEFVFTVVLDDTIPGADNPTPGVNDPVRGDLGFSFEQTITIDIQPVNDAPTPVPNALPLAFNLNEDGTFEIPLRNVTDSNNVTTPGILDQFIAGPQNEVGSIPQAEGGSQTLSLASFPGTTSQLGTLSTKLLNGIPVSLIYTPKANFAGRDSFTFTIADDGFSVALGSANVGAIDPGTVTGVVTLDVAQINDPPQFLGVSDVASNEDAGMVVVNNWATGIQAGPSDAVDEINGNGSVPPQTINFQFTLVSTTDPNLIVGTPSVTVSGSTGTLHYEVGVDAFGTAVYEVQAFDDGGTALNGINASTTQTFTITVNSVNDAPTFVAGGTVTVLEDSGSYDQPWTTTFSVGPPNESSQTLSFRVDTPLDKQPLFSSLPAIDSNGRLTFTPAADANGSIDILVTAVDSLGGESQTATLRITITPVNDAPTGGADTIESTVVNGVNQKDVNEDSVIVIPAADFLANDSDTDSALNPSESVSFLLQASTTTTLGATLTFDVATQSVFYDPRTSTTLQMLKPGQTANDTFTYQAVDQSNAASEPITVTVRVEGINDAPVLGADAPTVSRTSPTVLDLLSNDSDIDGDIVPASLIITQQPTGGSLNLEDDGRLTYTPFPEFTGSDFFRYTVGDDLGQQSEQASVTINGSNAPIGGVDNLSVRAGVNDLDVLSNDVLFGDATFDLTTLTIVTPPTGGTAVPQADGTIRYTSNEGFFGADFFEYVITDSEGRVSEPSRVDLNVTALGSQNPANFMDVSANGEVTAFDALLIINRLNIAGNVRSIPIDPDEPTPPYYDVNGDGFISAGDALEVIAEIRRLDNALLTGGSGEGEFLLADAINSSSMSVQISFNPTPITLPVQSSNPVDEMFSLGGDDDSLMKIQSSNFNGDVGIVDAIDLIAADSDGGSDGESSDSSLVAVDSLFADFDNLD